MERERDLQITLKQDGNIQNNDDNSHTTELTSISTQSAQSS